MAAWIATKKSTAMGLDMPHLVWNFYEKSCFKFLDMARKRKKWTKNNNNNNNNKKELDQNQESSPLLRWSLIKPLIKAFHRGITLHSIWTYDKVRGLLIIKLCPPDSEQNGHQAKMTTEISTQNLYNSKSYNVLSHVKVSWRHFF